MAGTEEAGGTGMPELPAEPLLAAGLTHLADSASPLRGIDRARVLADARRRRGRRAGTTVAAAALAVAVVGGGTVLLAAPSDGGASEGGGLASPASAAATAVPPVPTRAVPTGPPTAGRPAPTPAEHPAPGTTPADGGRNVRTFVQDPSFFEIGTPPDLPRWPVGLPASRAARQARDARQVAGLAPADQAAVLAPLRAAADAAGRLRGEGPVRDVYSDVALSPDYRGVDVYISDLARAPEYVDAMRALDPSADTGLVVFYEAPHSRAECDAEQARILAAQPGMPFRVNTLSASLGCRSINIGTDDPTAAQAYFADPATSPVGADYPIAVYPSAPASAMSEGMPAGPGGPSASASPGGSSAG
jgi:hypothetical protein